MIMRPGQQLLLPANPVFIWATLLGALLLNVLMSSGVWGRAPWAPDMLALVLVFWGVHQPLRVGVGVGFLFGLAMDVQQGSLLGQHALAYTALGFMAVSVHRRLLWFDMMTQAVQILPVLMVANVLQLIVRMIAGGMFPGWSLFIGPLAEGLLWPVVSMLLLAPQRRAPNPDDNRPL